MRFGQNPSDPNQTAPDYQKVLAQLSEGQHRLAYLEDQMQRYKIFMGVLTVISLIVVLLNKGCKK